MTLDFLTAAVVLASNLLGLALGSVLAPVLAPFDPDQQRLGEVLQAPSLRHAMGTDSFGRDVLSRALWGGACPR